MRNISGQRSGPSFQRERFHRLGSAQGTTCSYFPSYAPQLYVTAHTHARTSTTLTSFLAALAAFNAACTWKMLATLEEYGHQIPLTNRHVLLVVPSSFVRPFCVPLCRPPSLPSPSASVPRAHLERLGMNGCRRLSTLGRSYYTYRRLLSLLRTERSLFLSSPLQQQQQQHHHHDCRCS